MVESEGSRLPAGFRRRIARLTKRQFASEPNPQADVCNRCRRVSMVPSLHTMVVVRLVVRRLSLYKQKIIGCEQGMAEFGPCLQSRVLGGVARVAAHGLEPLQKIGRLSHFEIVGGPVQRAASITVVTRNRYHVVCRGVRARVTARPDRGRRSLTNGEFIRNKACVATVFSGVFP